MKRLLIILLTIAVSLDSFASHITGGELMYTYLGPGSAGTNRYTITLRLFRDCYSTGPLLQGEQVRVGIYSNRNNALIQTIQLPLTSEVNTIALNTNSFPCLVGSPQVCYQIAYFSNTVELERTEFGYTLVQTACCRIGGITNIANSNNAGATYTTKIPGTAILTSGNNSSPKFLLKDTALVCSSKSFRLPFGAYDEDGDSLSYTFADAYGNVSSNNQPLPPVLTLSTVSYSGNYNGQKPLGSGVSINPSTGLISGRAPATGRYVVAVNVQEWREGKLINEHRKDFILSVQYCDFVSAELPENWVECKDFTVTFENASYSSLITSYTWNFGDPTTTSDVSNSPIPSYTYPDSGKYRVKLVVKGSNGCIDSTEADIAVYPGFDVNFQAQARCINNPAIFIDSTVAAYGTINSWRWDFGDASVNNDTSSLKNPSYKYRSTGDYLVKLVASSTKGCVDTAVKTITITEKPYLNLQFKDTVVCGFDSLQLIAEGSGIFSWAPNAYISGGNTATPTVFPPASAMYIVTLNDNSCIGTDTVRITKLNSITVAVQKDTSICATDAIPLKAVSQANYYSWTPSNLALDPAKASTISRPINSNTNFKVDARLGNCTASASFAVSAFPYPGANAGSDVIICPDTKTQLSGNVAAEAFTWTPTYAMQNSNSLQPWVAPTNTTAYILTARNLSGCLKPVRDTVVVTVRPNPVAFAGNDTAIVKNQPLQLFATGGGSYEWSPATYLSSAFINNPFVNLPEGIDTVRYQLKVTDDNGCIGYDEIMISKFQTDATVFIPTGFTPNADGKNDVLRPVLAGIKQLDFFRVYNRWGQLIYETKEPGRGWNGTINGKAQNPGTYVFVIQAIDYLGKPVIQKGTVVLIR